MDQKSSKDEFHIEEVGLEFSKELPSTYPPQPHHAQAVSRSVEIERDNWKYSRYRVIEGTTQIYTANINFRKPHMVIETNEPIGTVVVHFHTSRMDITVHSESLTLVSHGFCMNKWTYTSPALQKTITWKRKSKACKIFDFVCLEEEVPVAQFTVNNWGVTRIGKLEFFGERVNSGVAMDEVVTTGLALANFLLVQIMVPGLALVSSIASV